MVQGKINRGRHTDNPAGRQSIRTNQQRTSVVPPFLRRMPFRHQPSQFILAWNMHQICWLAYPVAWCPVSKQVNLNTAPKSDSHKALASRTSFQFPVKSVQGQIKYTDLSLVAPCFDPPL